MTRNKCVGKGGWIKFWKSRKDFGSGNGDVMKVLKIFHGTRNEMFGNLNP